MINRRFTTYSPFFRVCNPVITETRLETVDKLNLSFSHHLIDGFRSVNRPIRSQKANADNRSFASIWLSKLPFTAQPDSYITLAFGLQNTWIDGTGKRPMSYLDWYLRLDERCRERGYNLALLVCPAPETVVSKIIPKAVEIACKNARKQTRRDEPSRKHWKMYFTDPQLYQISILEASQSHAKQVGSAPANWLTGYIGFLSLCTLQRNSFYVAIGFERILSTGSVKDILELYEWLSYRLSPDGPAIGRDEKSANDICSSLHEQIYMEFKDTFQTSGHRLMFDNVPKGSSGIDDEIHRILDRMIPWETEHLPNLSQPHPRSYQRMIAEMSLAHVCIDQQRCLEDAKRDNKHISRSFDTWKVPIPTNVIPAEPPTPTALRWPEVEEEIMKEIHWSEEKSKRGWGARFEVVVDGEIKDFITERGSIEIALPPYARYVEIRDAESQTIVANCHLMDPRDLPEAGWKSSVKVQTGGRIHFEFGLDKHGNEMVGLAMKIGIEAKRAWATSIRNWTAQMLQPRAWSGRGKSLAWIAYAASLMLALSITFIVLLGEWRENKRLEENIATISNLQAQLNQIQQENANLQAQLSTIPALETQIAELRQFQIQVLTSSQQISQTLYDGSRLVALDKQGNLTGVEAIPQRFQQMIKTALATGHVEAPELRALGRRKTTLMGEHVTSESFTLISPVGIVIETDRPTLRWESLKGAINYTVIISDANYNEVAVGRSLSGTQWTVNRPLDHGKVYLWQVTALKDGQEIKSPHAPGMMAKFQVLDQAKVDELAQAKKAYPNSHLIMGLLYARVGLLDDADREFKALLAANPQSPIVQKLLRKIQALRRSV